MEFEYQKEYALSLHVINELRKSVKQAIDANSTEKTFNILQAAVKNQLRETAHSRILANLLEYDPEIRDSFLSRFFQKNDLFKKEFEGKDWNISIEKNNMDIVLEGKFHENVIIIENKVNDACEQPEQIDRYVSHYIENTWYKKIYVLYLKREDHYGPTPYSWSKTGDCKLIAISYKDDMHGWIDEIIEDHSKKEGLGEALRPYTEYLDIMFNKDTEIMEDTKNKIKGLLDIEDTADKAGGNAVKLEKAENEFKLLMEACRSLRYEYTWANIRQRVNKILDENNLPELTDMNSVGWDLPDAGIPFKLSGFETQFYAVVSYLNECYIGILNLNQVKEKKEDFSSIFKEMLGSISDNHYSTIRYPIWFKIEEEKNLVNGYEQLIKVLVDNTKGHEPKVVTFDKKDSKYML